MIINFNLIKIIIAFRAILKKKAPKGHTGEGPIDNLQALGNRLTRG